MNVLPTCRMCLYHCSGPPNQPASPQVARQKDGALCMLGSLAKQVMNKVCRLWYALVFYCMSFDAFRLEIRGEGSD